MWQAQGELEAVRLLRVGLISSMNSPENGSATTVAASAPPQLLRALGWWEATAIVIGHHDWHGHFHCAGADHALDGHHGTRRSPCGRSRGC